MSGTKSSPDKLKGVRKLSLNLAKPMPLSIIEMPPGHGHSGSGASQHDERLPNDRSASQQSTDNGKRCRGKQIDSKRVRCFSLLGDLCKPLSIWLLPQLSQQRVEPVNLTIGFLHNEVRGLIQVRPFSPALQPLLHPLLIASAARPRMDKVVATLEEEDDCHKD